MFLLSSTPADVRLRSRRACARQGCGWPSHSRTYRIPGTYITRSANSESIPNDLELEFQLEALKPAVILVEPRMGENIGAAARAMKNFGLCDLRLVKPEDGWPNPLADATASHAIDLIRSARLYDSVTDAVADLERVYAATARTRFMAKAFVTSRQLPADLRQVAAVAAEAAAAAAAAEAAAAASPPPPPPPPSAALSPNHLHTDGSQPSSGTPSPGLTTSTPAPSPCEPDCPEAPPGPGGHGSEHGGSGAGQDVGREPGLDSLSQGPPGPAEAGGRRVRVRGRPRAGVMFGRENSGLTNEEVAAAHKVLTIEAHPDYPVLNLAQAVVCTAYELHHARLDAAGAAVGGPSAAATAGAGAGDGPITSRTASDPSGDGPRGGSSSSSGSSSASNSNSGSSSPVVSSSAEELRARAAALQLASRGEVEAFLQRLVSELDAAGFFPSADKRPATLLSIRNLAAKVDRMTAAEVALLHGMVSKLVGVGARGRRGGGRRPQSPEGETEGQGQKQGAEATQPGGTDTGGQGPGAGQGE